MAFKPVSGPIPFRDASGRFLPWVVAVMVYLAVLSFVGAVVLGNAVSDWQAGVRNRITVELSAAGGPQADKDLTAVLDLLRGTPGVLSAEPLSRKEVEALLVPWFGNGDISELPLPRLIDVLTDDAHPPDLEALGVAVSEIVADARIDNHQAWLAQLVTVGRYLQGIALVVVTIVLAATVLLVGFATRAGLATHREVIEVLHLIGARDAYIASQFQNHTMWLSLIGAAPGLVLAGASWLGLYGFMSGMDGGIVPSFSLGIVGWIGLLAVPLLAVLMATLAARLTVLRLLRKVL